MALVGNFSWVKLVDPLIRDLVSGYIRGGQNSLQSDNSYFNIPPSIEYMVLKYFWIEKECFVQCDHKDVAVHEKGQMVSRSYSPPVTVYRTVYGSVEVKSDWDLIYEWQVKIIKLRDEHQYRYRLGIGLCANNEIEECFLDGIEKETNGFLIWECGQIEDLCEEQYPCVSFKAGDVVKIVVNTKFQECNVYVNDTDKMDIEIDWHYNYYFAVCFGTKNIDTEEGISVKLIHFDCKQA